jgi:hypothetical protein
MSNGNQFERLWKLQAKVNMLVLDGKRNPERVANIYQSIISGSQHAAYRNCLDPYGNDPFAFVPQSETNNSEKFALLVDLGIITVPDDYDHATALTTFGKKNRKKFYYYDGEITDPNFPNPTRVLKPGNKLRVCAFKQVVGGTTTSEERMDFLRKEKAIFTGAQGASLVWDQKRDQLPKGKWYASFDERNRLWQDACGGHRVPYMCCHSDGDFGFDLGHFDRFWDDNGVFLCFYNTK